MIALKARLDAVAVQLFFGKDEFHINLPRDDTIGSLATDME